MHIFYSDFGRIAGDDNTVGARDHELVNFFFEKVIGGHAEIEGDPIRASEEEIGMDILKGNRDLRADERIVVVSIYTPE